MNCKLLLLCVHIVYSAPMQLRLLPDQQQSLMLRQLMPAVNPPMVMYPQLPMMILLPTPMKLQSSKSDDNRYINLNEHRHTEDNVKSKIGFIDEDSEAIVIDAEPNLKDNSPKNRLEVFNGDSRPKAAVLLPNQGRLSIGDIISYIPFLPIEINVPDSISSIYNFFAGLGWFRPTTPGENVKSFSKNAPMMPVFIMPLGAPTLPGRL